MLTRDEAVAAISEPLDDTNAPKEAGILEAEQARVEVDGRKQYYALRNDWSGYIACWITALILFNAGLTVGVGTEIFSFTDMQSFVTAVTVETFLQIVGMGYIAVKYLFSNN